MPLEAGESEYGAADAFSARLAKMGCPASGCIGYELRNDLDLSDYSSWRPIGDRVTHGSGYSAIFDGKNFTISSLAAVYVPGVAHKGLFGSLAEDGSVRMSTS